MRDGRWKLCCSYSGDSVQLYDIPADPEERTSLAEQQPEVVARMKPQLLAWKKTLPPGPVEEGPPVRRPKAKPAAKRK